MTGTAYKPTAIDVWSSAVVLFVAVEGRFPFSEPTHNCEQYRTLQNNAFEFPVGFGQNLTILLAGMFCIDPKTRWTLSQIKSSEWWNESEVTTAVAPTVGTPETDGTQQAASLREGTPVSRRLISQCAAELQSHGMPLSPGVAGVVANLLQTAACLNGGLAPADAIALRVLFDGISTLMGLSSKQIADVAQTAFRHARENLSPQGPAGNAATPFCDAREHQAPVAAVQLAPVVARHPLSSTMPGFVCAPQHRFDALSPPTSPSRVYLNAHNTEYQTCQNALQPDGCHKRLKISKQLVCNSDNKC